MGKIKNSYVIQRRHIITPPSGCMRCENYSTLQQVVSQLFVAPHTEDVEKLKRLSQDELHDEPSLPNRLLRKLTTERRAGSLRIRRRTRRLRHSQVRPHSLARPASAGVQPDTQ